MTDGAEQYFQYTLYARAGQMLDAEPLDDRSAGSADVDVIDPDGVGLRKERAGQHWRFGLSSTALYDLVVDSRRAAVPYPLKSSIR